MNFPWFACVVCCGVAVVGAGDNCSDIYTKFVVVYARDDGQNDFKSVDDECGCYNDVVGGGVDDDDVNTDDDNSIILQYDDVVNWCCHWFKRCNCCWTLQCNVLVLILMLKMML